MKQGEAEVDLEENASNAPDIARLSPSEFEDDLRRPVVSSGHNGRMMLPVEGGRTEVDNLYVGVLCQSFISLLYGAVRTLRSFNCIQHAELEMRSKAYFSLIINGLKVRVDKQNVLRLQVSVRQMVVVQDLKNQREREKEIKDLGVKMIQKRYLRCWNPHLTAIMSW